MRTSVCRAFCFVLLLGLILLTACRPNAPTAAQPRSSGEPKASEAVALPDSNALVRVWTTADGLPINFVEAMAQTPDGYLWLATSAGLVRFDGVRFRLYGKEDLDGWEDTYMRLLHVDRRGRLFVLSNRGEVSVLEGEQLRLLVPGVTDANGARLSSPQSVLETSDGTIWIGQGDAGLVRLDTALQFTRFPLPTGVRILRDVHRFSNGQIVASAEGQLVRLVRERSGTERLVAFGPPISLVGITMQSVSDTFYVSTRGPLLRVTVPDAAADPRVEALDVPRHVDYTVLLRVQPDGTFLLVADAGIVSYRLGAPLASARVLVPRGRIRSGTPFKDGGGIGWDRGGKSVWWISTTEAEGRTGIEMMDANGRRTVLRLPAGMEPSDGTDILEGSNGVWWFATSHGLVRAMPRRASSLGPADGLTGIRQVFAVAFAPDSTLYVGTWGSGIFARLHGSTRFSHVASDLDFVRTFSADSSGRMWASGADGFRQVTALRGGRAVLTVRDSVREGIERLSWVNGSLFGGAGLLAEIREAVPGRFVWKPVAFPDTNSAPIRVIHKDRRGRLWVGAGSGLLVQERGSTGWRRHPAVTFSVMNLYEDARGDFYVGTRGAGLIRLYGASTADDPMRVRTFTYTRAQHGLHHDGIWWVQPDRGGYLWMTSDMGLGRYTQQMLDDVADGRAARLSPLVLTQADGLPSDEFDSGQPGGTIDARGVMYFPTLKGVAVVDPRNVRPDSAPPPVVLQEVTVDGVARDTIPAQFPPGTRNLAFRYAALDLVRPEGTRYRVRLDGFDPDWVEMGSRREAVYSNLPPGRYTLRVRGMNGDGKWNDVGAAQTFEIAPHWWETLWARLAFLLGVMGLGYAGWRFQTNRMRTVELAAMVDERTAELRAERDTVAAQRAELAAQHTALQTLDRLKADLVASVSHEFRTPLMLVLGHLEDVLRRDALGADDQQQVRQAVRGAKRLERLVTQLLGVARLEADTRQSEAHVANFSDFVCSVTEAFTEVARRAGVSLECSTPPGVPVAFAPDAAEVILANLLSNALKFTPRGGHVRVSVVQDDGEAVVRVRDTGVGLSPGHLARIFDRFYQVDGTGTRSSDGAGIGLDLAHELARQQGGSLSAESEGLGFGCTFTLRLPLASKGEDGQPLPVAPSSNLTPHLEDVAGVLGLDAPEPPAHEAARAPAVDQPLVLVVDDHAAIRDLLARQLGEAFRVVAVSGGKRALVEARRQAFDAVVCDVMMPDMDGPTVLKAFRADAQLADVPFLFLTAKDDLSTEVEGFEHGADGYLVKPCPPERLEARLGRMVERRRRQREALVEAAGAGRVQPRTPNEKYVQQATEIVKERMGDSTFNAESLAEAMFTTVPTLNRTLKRIAGKSSGAFIHVLKMERAAVLLGGGSSVAEAARAVGYRDAEHFSRMFQRYHGINPRDWKGRNGS